MMLNKWECSEPGCTSTAVGNGGAIGLRAIGWWFEAGQKPRCPAHRVDGTLKRSKGVPCEQEGPCGPCSGEYEADRLQYVIAQYLEMMGAELIYTKSRADAWKDHQ